MGDFGKIMSSFSTSVPRVTKNNHVGSNSSVSSLNKKNTTQNIKNSLTNQKQTEEMNFAKQEAEKKRKIQQAVNETNRIFSGIKTNMNTSSMTLLANDVKKSYEKTGATISKEQEAIYILSNAQEKMTSLNYEQKWHEKVLENASETFQDVWGTTKDVVSYAWEDTKAIISGDITPLEVAEGAVDNVRISTAYTVGKITGQSDEAIASVVSDVKEEVENDDYIEDTVYGIATGVENTKQSFKQAGNEMSQAGKDLISGKITPGQFFERVCATGDNFIISTTEGVFKWGEKYADGLKITGGYFINSSAEALGIITEDEMYDNLEVIQDDVEINATKEMYDMFYNETEYGNWIRDNSYAYETVRGLGNMAGEMLMNVGTSYAVGNMVSNNVLTKSRVGISVDDAAAIKATEIQAIKAGNTAGNITLYTNTSITGMGEGAEIALANGGSIEEAVITGAVTGAWNTAQYAVGQKISNFNAAKTNIGESLLKSKVGTKIHLNENVLNIGSRIALDSVTGASEGFVQPLISMIYKDGYYDKNGRYIEYGNNMFKNYSGTFQEAGGMKNVGTNALYGALGSAFGEATDLVSKHPINKKTIDAEKTNPLPDIDFELEPDANLYNDSFFGLRINGSVIDDAVFNEYDRLMNIKNSDEYKNYINNPSGKAQVLIKDFENVDARLAKLETKLNAQYNKNNSSSSKYKNATTKFSSSNLPNIDKKTMQKVKVEGIGKCYFDEKTGLFHSKKGKVFRINEKGLMEFLDYDKKNNSYYNINKSAMQKVDVEGIGKCYFDERSGIFYNDDGKIFKINNNGKLINLNYDSKNKFYYDDNNNYFDYKGNEIGLYQYRGKGYQVEKGYYDLVEKILMEPNPSKNYDNFIKLFDYNNHKYSSESKEKIFKSIFEEVKYGNKEAEHFLDAIFRSKIENPNFEIIVGPKIDGAYYQPLEKNIYMNNTYDHRTFYHEGEHLFFSYILDSKAPDNYFEIRPDLPNEILNNPSKRNLFYSKMEHYYNMCDSICKMAEKNFLESKGMDINQYKQTIQSSIENNYDYSTVEGRTRIADEAGLTGNVREAVINNPSNADEISDNIVDYTLSQQRTKAIQENCPDIAAISDIYSALCDGGNGSTEFGKSVFRFGQHPKQYYEVRPPDMKFNEQLANFNQLRTMNTKRSREILEDFKFIVGDEYYNTLETYRNMTLFAE